MKEEKNMEICNVRIIPFEPVYRNVFKSLNVEWISSYFEMEEADYKILDKPEDIARNGGAILIALYNDKPVGVCALLKMEDGNYDFELAKMAVSPKVQGRHIGFLLGQAAVNKAMELGASKIFLATNTILQPAVKLYQKLGFKETIGYKSPYRRCNLQMVLSLA